MIGAVHAGGYQVPFKTMGCNGNSGFAAVRIDLIRRIDHFDFDPAQTDIQLKRVLVRAYGTGFDAFTVTGQQARQLPAKMARHTEAQRRALERSDTFYMTRY